MLLLYFIVIFILNLLMLLSVGNNYKGKIHESF